MDEKKIIEQYYELRSCRAVAEANGCSESKIRRILIDNNIDRTGWKTAPQYALPKKSYPRKYEHVRYDKVCLYCGKEFAAHRKDNSYCSRKCRDVALKLKRGTRCNPNTEPFHKVCLICGKPFDTFREATITCSSECSKERDRLRKRNDKRYKLSWDKYVAKVKAEAEERNKERQLVKSRIDLIRHINAYANKRVPKECAFCGDTFYSEYPDKKYCSADCSRKANNRKRDKRIPKDKIIDKDITLQKLFKRDRGVCWICGCRCDWDDKRISKSGYEYPGDTYPTKDHVIPVSKGGTESWDNVRLACWKCNCPEKGDKLYPYVPLEIEFAYSCKSKGTQPKRTAQYTLDGELIKIWESTASIRRELGLNDKHIQNVCRRDNSNTGNAYGFHWEYVKEA